MILPLLAFSPEDVERFFRKVSPEPNSGCWLWMGGGSGNGYGRVWMNGSLCSAHRISFEMHRGPITDGMVIDHLCRVRSCVNPSHLEVVTVGENVRRGILADVARARQLAKTHCPYGHPYSGDNLYVMPGGGRACRTCARAREIARSGHRKRIAR